MSLKKILTFSLLITCAIFFCYSFVLAANLGDAFGHDGYIDQAAGEEGAGYDTEGDEVEIIIATIIQTALSFLGVIFLMLMIYGGYLWMTARGNEEQTTKAKNTITAAIIGIVIVLSAYAISYFVVKKLGDKALESTTSATQTNFAISRKANKI
ncbi:hypothetical protein KAU19_07015 [Candidatus Parcubacteria bacterium]|nr:hypothetical protein [Candidatus Parcubacteria bacterium]